MYAEGLLKLIACETVNTPGADNLHKFQHMEQTMAALFPTVFQKFKRIPIKDALLMHLNGKDPHKPAVLLMAHLDVVPATGAWSVPPFEGAIKDGCVFGRGAMDTKNSLYAMYQAMEELLQKGYEPPCDLYLSSSYNEETFGPGAANVRDYFKENQITLQLVFDEGGAVVENPMPGLNGRFAMIGVTEKGYALVRFVARSKGGHASSPPKNSPVARLSAFVNRMEKSPPFYSNFPPVVKDMFKALTPHMSQPYKFVFSNLWLFGGLLKIYMPSFSPQAAAMLKTTCAFTMMEGSTAPNVLPETASVTANMRFISHQPMKESLQMVAKSAALFGIETQIIYANDVSPETSRKAEMYQLVKRTCESVFKDVPVAPYLMVAATDSRLFTGICPNVIRFSTAILSPAQLNAMHGLDENISIESLALSVRFYEDLLQNL